MKKSLLVLIITCVGFANTGLSADAVLVIENATLIDGTGREPVPHTSTLIKGNHIEQVIRGTFSDEIKQGAEVVDASGKFLIPGLIDTHIHLEGSKRKIVNPVDKKVKKPRNPGVRALHSYLYSGVTSVYDAGNDPAHILGLREKERSGKIIAPRIFATGGIVTYPGSHGSSEGATLVDSWPEAIPLLDKHIAKQPDMVKLTFEERGWGARPMIPLLPLDLMQKIIHYYNERGIRTVVHASNERRARQAMFVGIDSLAHPVISGPITDNFALLLGVKKIPMSSTLAIGDNYSRLAEHPEYLDQALYQASYNAEEIKHLKTEKSEVFKEQVWTWWMKLMTPVAQENLRKIHEAGGVIALGTDQTVGPAVHREMELLADAGIPNLDIIKIGTLNAATLLGKERELGSIEENKLADLVLLDANPVEDINNTKKINLVIKNGEIINREKLNLPGNRR